jgi:hypothetical protein
VVISGFAVTATVIVADFPVVAAVVDAPDAAAVEELLAPDLLDEEHALTMTDRAETTATADATRRCLLRRLVGRTCTVPPR